MFHMIYKKLDSHVNHIAIAYYKGIFLFSSCTKETPIGNCNYIELRLALLSCCFTATLILNDRHANSCNFISDLPPP